MHEAHLFEKLDENVVRCALCSHRCTIHNGKHGICGVRINREGTLYAATYGSVFKSADGGAIWNKINADLSETPIQTLAIDPRGQTLSMLKRTSRQESVSARVRLIDLMPTVLNLVKIPFNKEIQGISLVPYMEGREKRGLVCYLETYYPLEDHGWSPLIGLVEQNWKYIEAPRPELYYLADDRAEEENVVASKQKVFSSLKEELREVIKTCSSEANVPQRKMTFEEEERLRALGYLGGGAPGVAPKGPLPDPKDRIDEARAELMEIVDFLKTPDRYRRLGGKIPKGVLLVGAPGTGKSSLVNQLALHFASQQTTNKSLAL
jgi:hypothetical protein